MAERFSNRLFAKNPSFDRKQREQRKSKRLKQVLPGEHLKLDKILLALVRRSKTVQKNKFGYRLSQVPGDGGKIPNLEYSVETHHCVKKYYSKYTGNEENTVEYRKNEDKYINQICREPNKTFGQFKDQEPLINKNFYKPFEGYYPLSKYVQGTMKRTISNFKKEMPERFKGTQAYCGLQVETLFANTDPEKLAIVRQLEIEIKQGQINPNNPFLDLELQKKWIKGEILKDHQQKYLNSGYYEGK